MGRSTEGGGLFVDNVQGCGAMGLVGATRDISEVSMLRDTLSFLNGVFTTRGGVDSGLEGVKLFRITVGFFKAHFFTGVFTKREFLVRVKPWNLAKGFLGVTLDFRLSRTVEGGRLHRLWLKSG